ncbi:hypothetical protein AAG570_005168 [Ranatra chinensis]|uniref:Ribosomal RNA-processing protein 42 n=1 Tax=Ranatra chinensis TaxID=642074 RepID=A0ABD0XZR6_9HEMI
MDLSFNLTSNDEKFYLKDGINKNIRNDGRIRNQYRELEIFPDIISSSMGSSRVKLGGNDIVVSVNGELCIPSRSSPESGLIDFVIDFSPDASDTLNFYHGDTYSDEIMKVLRNVYNSADLKSLCVIPGVKCWKLNTTILVLFAGGCLYDAISFAMKVALRRLKLPRVTVTDMDAGTWNYTISEDEVETINPHVYDVPNIITFVKIGSVFLIDPTFEEELCNLFVVVVSVSSSGNIMHVVKEGAGCLRPRTMMKLFQDASVIGRKIEDQFKQADKTYSLVK